MTRFIWPNCHLQPGKQTCFCYLIMGQNFEHQYAPRWDTWFNHGTRYCTTQLRMITDWYLQQACTDTEKSIQEVLKRRISNNQGAKSIKLNYSSNPQNGKHHIAHILTGYRTFFIPPDGGAAELCKLSDHVLVSLPPLLLPSDRREELLVCHHADMWSLSRQFLL